MPASVHSSQRTFPLADPKTVTAAKFVRLAIVSYINEYNQEVTQFAVIGDNRVQLLESRALGLSKNSTPFGAAADWLKEGVLKLLEEAEVEALANDSAISDDVKKLKKFASDVEKVTKEKK